ncbi:MAG: TraR/DksA C4-type zinc finger protein [Candidatus Cloacimonetes bacterium]|nr:TraR/DksA C4-type zinc finger protein [Candidatus Cloacimonadota bacterium]MCF7814523.1 TraR/DksA C4-type zinc finger protein [Candidatus Cloacimonadota bacterium]MCF7867685.1 TraR/DksA C4-type zinc finger protein [Candidatus Cloacimonadota bacterium]MCF7883517.1 TraR/DksA C4-type zinc finger protein [Candidatus Cloacimonadota bacterium]
MQYPKFEEVVKFHGHSCPGLAMGYKLTLAALEKLNKLRAEDEEIVAIVENDACGTDAVQFISGCTFGKGNFIFKDHGKMVYTFICRKSGRAIRASRNPDFLNRVKKEESSREELINQILESKSEDFANLEEISIELPPEAKLYKNIVCEECGETAMETRIRKRDGRKLCIPCAENIKKYI